MKKSQQLLLKLASKFQTKYAQAQTLKEIIQNAASSGKNGIMNFPLMLQKDKAILRLNVRIDGDTAKVSSPPTVTPGDTTPNDYTKLPEQIKKYLDTYLKYFPQIPKGEDILLEYGGANSGIAKQ